MRPANYHAFRRSACLCCTVFRFRRVMLRSFTVSSLSELEDMEYRKVVVCGRFDHSNELYVMPRSLVPGTEQLHQSSPSSRKFGSIPKSGANVITAFKLSSDQHPKYVYCWRPSYCFDCHLNVAVTVSRLLLKNWWHCFRWYSCLRWAEACNRSST